MDEILTVSEYLVNHAETIGEELTKRVVEEAQSLDENIDIKPYIANIKRNQELITILGAALNKPKEKAEIEQYRKSGMISVEDCNSKSVESGIVYFAGNFCRGM